MINPGLRHRMDEIPAQVVSDSDNLTSRFARLTDWMGSEIISRSLYRLLNFLTSSDSD